MLVGFPSYIFYSDQTEKGMKSQINGQTLCGEPHTIHDFSSGSFPLAASGHRLNTKRQVAR